MSLNSQAASTVNDSRNFPPDDLSLGLSQQDLPIDGAIAGIGNNYSSASASGSLSGLSGNGTLPKKRKSSARKVQQQPNGNSSLSSSSIGSMEDSPSELSSLLRELRSLTAALRTHIEHSDKNFLELRTQLNTYGDRIELNRKAVEEANLYAAKMDQRLTQIEGNLQNTALQESLLTHNDRQLDAPQCPDSEQTQFALRDEAAVNQLAAEIEDRLSRSRNVVLFNVREEGGNGPSDVDTTTRLLSKMEEVCTQNISVRRIGNVHVGEEPRPLLVTLKSQGDVFKVIGQRDKLPLSVSVAPDRTRAQRDLWRKAKDKADAYNAVCPDKVMVKYIDGVPKIVPDTRPPRPPGPPEAAAGSRNNNRNRRSKNL